jgi:hypothetical protein
VLIVLVLAALAHSSSSSALGWCGHTHWYCAGSAGPFVVLLSAGVAWSYPLVLVLAALARSSSSSALVWCGCHTCWRCTGASGVHAGAGRAGPFVILVGTGVAWLYPLVLCWWRWCWCWQRGPVCRPRRRWGGAVVPIGFVLIMLVLAALAHSSSSLALGWCGRIHWCCTGGVGAGAGSAGLFVVLVGAGVAWSYLLALC